MSDFIIENFKSWIFSESHCWKMTMVEWLSMEFVLENFICLILVEIISWKMSWKNYFAGKCPNEMAKSENFRIMITKKLLSIQQSPS